MIVKTKYFVRVFPPFGVAYELQVVAVFKRRKSSGGYVMAYHPDMSVYEKLDKIADEWSIFIRSAWLARGFDKKVFVNFNFDFVPNARFILVDFKQCDMKNIIVKEEE